MIKIQANNTGSQVKWRTSGMGDSGTIILFTCRSTTYRLNRMNQETEEDALTIASYFQEQVSQAYGVENINIQSTKEQFLVEVTFSKEKKWTSFDAMKADILTDEFILDQETGIRLRTEDILFEYEMEVHQMTYEPNEAVPFGGAFR
ncbi:hypothetical protein [Metaplanococcus flavidus]|uniref:Uncharacterized protein n=1 Tax=Metaplanococcus flavidus TaxID=569883 RepID=A0ABW3LBC0_9BACL